MHSLIYQQTYVNIKSQIKLLNDYIIDNKYKGVIMAKQIQTIHCDGMAFDIKITFPRSRSKACLP